MHEQTFLNIKYFQTCNFFITVGNFEFLLKKLENVKTIEIDSPSLSLSQISVWVVTFSCQGVADLIS